jgi:O-antigen ligase
VGPAARLHTIVGPVAVLRPLLLTAAVGSVLYILDRTPVRGLSSLKHPMPILVLFLIAWATMGAPFALYPGLAVRKLFEELYPVGLMFLLCAAAVRNLHDVRRLMFVYALGAVVYSANLIAVAGYRGSGAGGYDANDAAMYIVSGMPLIVHFILRARGASTKLFLSAGLLICLLGMVRTGSRGAFLGLLAVVAYTVFASRSIRAPARLAIGIGVVAAFAMVSHGQPEYRERISSLRSIDEDYNSFELFGRKQLWSRGAEYIFANPLLGVGLENFYVAESRHPLVTSRIAVGIGAKYSTPHSQWVQAGVELGFPGLIVFIALYLVPVVRFRQWGARARAAGAGQPFLELASMGDALTGTLLALAVAGTFLSQAYGYPVWAAFGISAGLLKIAALHQVAARKGVPIRRSDRQLPSHQSQPMPQR